MTSDPAMHRRVRRLENDTESIYELIGDFRAEFTEFRSETRAEFASVRTELNDFKTETREQFSLITETLTEVVRRLPEPS
jgi:archaellum component FlaC